jgi:hypothetical protein
LRSCPQRDLIGSAAAERYPLGCTEGEVYVVSRRTLGIGAIAFGACAIARDGAGQTCVASPILPIQHARSDAELFDPPQLNAIR